MRTVEIVTNGKTFVIVDFPKDAINEYLDSNRLLWFDENVEQDFIDLPIGEYSIVGFALSLTEKEWARILGEMWQSGKSWLEANGIADFKNPFILIKK